MYTAHEMKKSSIDQISEHMWQAVVSGDDTASFYYAVRSTGIYCRPGCSSRLPNRKNVEFFYTWQQAEEVGYRACKRCSPRNQRGETNYAAIISSACQQIEASTLPPRLNDLAQKANLSVSHFHRLFKEIVGVTPRQFYDQVRLNRVQLMLEQKTAVTEAIYAAGYQTSSRFYEDVTSKLGMTPLEYQKEGQNQIINYVTATCYLGWVLVAVTERGVCAIDLGDDPDSLISILAARFPAATLSEDDPTYVDWINQVINYLQTPAQGFDLPMDIQGTAFQRRVWEALQEIPVGQTSSYSEIAEKIGSPQAARAVANACAANKLAAVIPCHRVVPKAGGLGGYRWGITRKRALLDREKLAVS